MTNMTNTEIFAVAVGIITALVVIWTHVVSIVVGLVIAAAVVLLGVALAGVIRKRRNRKR
jgi:O-antigen/teichoic acid export membrane protein